MMTHKWIAMLTLALGLCVLGTPQAVLGSDQGGVATDTPAPNFTLTDTQGNEHSLSDFAGKTVVLEWTNPQCPFVKKFYNEGHMQGWQAAYTENPDIVWLSIASSAPGKQGYFSEDEWNSIIQEKNINATAVLLDADGAVGRLFDAKTTPHIYVIDGDGVLRYQGAIDSKKSTKTAHIDSATNYLAAAVDAVVADQDVQEKTTTPYGCSVKYAN